jgi:hypothetical protein
MATTTNKQTEINLDNARINGIQKHCMQQASILVGGVAYTPAQAIQIYQNDLDATQAVVQARSALKAAMAKAKTTHATTTTFDGAFKRCIEGAYAGEPDTLDDFGVTVKGYTPPTVATKAEALVKTKATRALHHIMGTKQRAQLSAAASDVSAPASVTTPATPAPTGK